MQEAALYCPVIFGVAEVAPAEVIVTPTAPDIVISPVAPVLITLITEPIAKATEELSGIVTATFEVLEYRISLFLASAITKVSVVPATSLRVNDPRLVSIDEPSDLIALAPSFTNELSSGVVQLKIEVVAMC